MYKARHKLSKAARCVKKLSKKDLTDEDRAKLIEEVSILRKLVLAVDPRIIQIS